MGDTRCSNPGFDDRWTCPACFEDLPIKFATTCTCPCGARVRLTLESQPVCVTEVMGPDGAGCEDCGETDFTPNVEAFETLGQLLCDDCAPAALEEAAEAA